MKIVYVQYRVAVLLQNVIKQFNSFVQLKNNSPKKMTLNIQTKKTLL